MRGGHPANRLTYSASLNLTKELRAPLVDTVCGVKSDAGTICGVKSNAGTICGV